MKLKICGIQDPDNMMMVSGFLPDFLGFIFYEGSPRYVRYPERLLSTPAIPRSIQKVGVYVNEQKDRIISDTKAYNLDFIQLHGREPVSLCKELGRKHIGVIKVFSMDDNFDFNQLAAYVDVVDYFLFDTKGKYLGGNGIPFDWHIIDRYPYEVPFFLSGGIGIDNIDHVQYIDHPALAGIDVNSKLERSPGMKDPGLLEQFKKKFDAINDR